ncbi:MAG: hypothetical protein N2043_04435, partial [Ignavibacterium sp.]|nr:hypothetical protein [Ignavibacterium sp.]
VGVSIKDFFFINKNTLLLYGKNRAGKSVILLSTPDFNNFNTILEVEGKITCLDYDAIHKWIYFVKTTDKGSELYKFLLGL